MSRGALRAMFRPYVEFDFTRMAFDTRVSFSRSSTGTYFDAAGVMQTATSNTPRKGHNPATGAVRGLLLEEQRTNLLLPSQEFDNSAWFKRQVSVAANSGVAPDGNTTADRIVATTEFNSHFLETSGVSKSAGLAYTISAVVSSAGYGGFGIAWGASRLFANFNLISGSVVNSFANGVDFTGASASISQIGSGTYRAAVTGISSNAIAYPIRFGVSSNPENSTHTGNSYTGDGTSGIYIWGAQLEAGSYPTSYIPTTTATVTRSADVATFTIPARVVRLVTIYDDGTTSQQAVTPGASYTIPTGQKPILRIRGYFA